MKLLFDFFPIVLFFLGYQFFGLYYATGIAIVASLVQVIVYRLKYQKFDKLQLTSFFIIFILGSATLFFQNPWFIKWKPTGIYWLTGLVFIGSMFVGRKPLIQRMMEQNIALPTHVWKRLNIAWALFFTLIGFINLYVAYMFSTDVWVHFKFFGGIGLTLVFVVIQALYLARHIDEGHLQTGEQS